MIRKQRAGRVVVVILLLMAGGAIVNVAAAWGCGLRDSMTPKRFSGLMIPASQEARAHWDAVFGPCVHLASRDEIEKLSPAAAPLSPTLGSMVFMLSELRIERFGMHGVQMSDQLRAIEVSMLVICAGWPMRALQMERMNEPSGIPGGTKTWSRHSVKLPWLRAGSRSVELPARPIWPGFAINTIFYAAILWLIFFTPGKVRRFIRRRRGLCPKCAYPIGSSAVCTECGAQLPSPSR